MLTAEDFIEDVPRHHWVHLLDGVEKRSHVVDRLARIRVKDDVPVLAKLEIPQTTDRVQVARHCGRVAVLVYNRFPGFVLTFERSMVTFELVVSPLQVAEAVPEMT